jgi:Polyketide cyclase / dehydrase and lipid transport
MQQDDEMTDQVQGTETIAASPEQIYALISDLPRMGEWSPENIGGKWLRGASCAAVGATFKGENRQGSKSWSTKVTITDAEPGKTFAFTVTAGPLSVAEWRYDLAADGASTTVTETWRDRRNPVLKRLGGIVAGVSDRATYTQVSINTTLAALKLAAEAQTAS